MRCTARRASARSRDKYRACSTHAWNAEVTARTRMRAKQLDRIRRWRLSPPTTSRQRMNANEYARLVHARMNRSARRTRSNQSSRSRARVSLPTSTARAHV